MAPALRAAGRCVTGIPRNVFPLVKAVNDVDRQQDLPSHHTVVHHTKIYPTQRIYGAFRRWQHASAGERENNLNHQNAWVWEFGTQFETLTLGGRSVQYGARVGKYTGKKCLSRFSWFFRLGWTLTSLLLSDSPFSLRWRLSPTSSVSHTAADAKSRKNRRSGDAFRGRILNKSNQLLHLWVAKSSWLSGPLERCKRYLISIGIKIKGK